MASVKETEAVPLYVRVDPLIYEEVKTIFETFGLKRTIEQTLMYLAFLNKKRDTAIVSRQVADIMLGNFKND